MHTPHVNNFSLAKYQFILQATTKIVLPPFAGSSLRTAFSEIFQKNTCTQPNSSVCTHCENRNDCTYFQMFENSGEFGALQLNRFKTPPKPFIFEPPMNFKSQIYERKQEFGCNLLLIGRAIPEFPQFVTAFKQMGERGFGVRQGTFFLKEVIGQHLLSNSSQRVYSDATGLTGETDFTFQLNDLLQTYQLPHSKLNRVHIKFLTPTRIKSSGAFGSPFNFKVFVQTLLTRISNIAYNYCDQTRSLNFRHLVDLAQPVKVVTENVPRRQEPRFQAQDELEMFLGGYVGEITYAGDLAPFWPWLKVGEIIHVGKNSAFGLGQYLVSAVED